MAGSSNITGDESVYSTDNLSFDGTRRGGALSADGEIWIGATASDRANNGGHVRKGTLTGGAGVSITNAAGSITIGLTGGGAGIDSFTTTISGPVTPTGAGVVDLRGANIYTDGGTANQVRFNVQATSNTFLIGAGTNTPATELGPLTNGQLIIGSTGVAPVAGSLASADASVTITGGAGTIDLSVADVPANPASRLLDFDDFLGSSASANNNSKFGWYVSDLVENEDATVSGNAGHPGIWVLDKAGWIQMGSVGTAAGAFEIGGGILKCTWYIKIANLAVSGDYVLRVGMKEVNASEDTRNNAVWFKYTDNVNSGDWQVESINGGSATTNNTGSTADTNWVKLEIEINAAGTSVKYSLDGTEVTNSPITTNIPATRFSPFLQSALASGVGGKFVWADLVVMDYTLTTSR